jgi:hypothetical protein
MKKAYKSLYNKVYEDLNPNTEDMSNGDMEDQVCEYKLNKDIVKQAYALIKAERDSRLAKMVA